MKFCAAGDTGSDSLLAGCDNGTA